MKKSLSCLLCISTIALSGCFGAHQRYPKLTDADLKKRLGTIGVYVARAPGKQPHDDAPTPATGPLSGFGRGASLGFNAVGGSAWYSGGSSSTGSSSGEAAIVYAGILALTGAAALGGGIYGTFASLFQGESKEDVAAAKAAIEQAMRDNDPVAGLKAEFRRLAKERRDLKLIVLDSAEAPAEGIDSTLLVYVAHAGLAGKKGINPDLWVLLSLRCAVRSPRLLYGGYLRVVGYDNKKKRRKFLRWAEADARPLRDELGLAYPFLAESALKAMLDAKGMQAKPAEPARAK